MTAEPIVALSGVVKDYVVAGQPQRVLHGIDMTVAADGLTLLVGPSGCGKTTLLTIIAGLLRTTTGRVDVCGTRVDQLAERELASFRRRHIGFVFQQYNLLPSLSAAENAAISLVAQGLSLGEGVRRVMPLLDRLGLAAEAGKHPGQLSGGQRQRVAIARALVHEPHLVIADEPTAALDATRGHQTVKLLSDMAVAGGRAVLIVTHDHRIEGFAHRIIHMEDGQLTGSRPGLQA